MVKTSDISTETAFSNSFSGMSSPSPIAQLNRDVEDDDVFMQLELPLEVIFLHFILIFQTFLIISNISNLSKSIFLISLNIYSIIYNRVHRSNLMIVAGFFLWRFLPTRSDLASKRATTSSHLIFPATSTGFRHPPEDELSKFA